MTSEEAIQRLENLSTDPEEGHVNADDILLSVLRANGLADVADAWLAASYRVGFWYA